MQYLKTKLIAASLVAGIMAPAIAHEGPAELDTDGDGLISRDEFRLPEDRRRQRMLHIFVRHPAARGSRRLVQDARAHPAHEAAPPLYKADI